jgi:hypothetical protein
MPRLLCLAHLPIQWLDSHAHRYPFCAYLYHIAKFEKHSHSIQFSLAQFAAGYSIGIEVRLSSIFVWHMVRRLIVRIDVLHKGVLSAAPTKRLYAHYS